MNASEAYNSALRLLTVRDRTEKELTDRLTRKGFCEEDIFIALQRCRELNYLDDERFALERARSLLRRGRAVGQGIVHDLRQRGIDRTLAEAATTEAEREMPPHEVLRSLFEKRFGGTETCLADEKARRRAINFFLRRGFPLHQVLELIKENRKGHQIES